MKKLFFGALVACAAATFVGCGNSTPKADLKTDVDTMSYAMGMSQTQGLKEFMVERMGVDTAYMDDFIKGLNDGANAGDDKIEHIMKGASDGMKELKEILEK
jgi:hypothetical protein